MTAPAAVSHDRLLQRCATLCLRSIPALCSNPVRDGICQAARDAGKYLDLHHSQSAGELSVSTSTSSSRRRSQDRNRGALGIDEDSRGGAVGKTPTGTIASSVVVLLDVHLQALLDLLLFLEVLLATDEPSPLPVGCCCSDLPTLVEREFFRCEQKLRDFAAYCRLQVEGWPPANLHAASRTTCEEDFYDRLREEAHSLFLRSMLAEADVRRFVADNGLFLVGPGGSTVEGAKSFSVKLRSECEQSRTTAYVARCGKASRAEVQAALERRYPNAKDDLGNGFNVNVAANIQAVLDQLLGSGEEDVGTIIH